MFRGESEISNMSGLSLSHAPGSKNTLGAQRGLCLSNCAGTQRTGLVKAAQQKRLCSWQPSPQAYQSLDLCAH